MVGSMLIVEAENRAAVETILKQDPYRKAELFSTIDVRGWRWVVGLPIN